MPKRFSFRNLIHLEAISSVSTTTELILGPAAVSKAKEYFLSASPSSETVPWIPEIVDSFIFLIANNMVFQMFFSFI